MTDLTIEDVKAAAGALIERDGAATTLWIKNSLRRHGFRAKQEDVAKFMDEITTNELIPGIAYTFNGQYRTYFLYDALEEVDDADACEMCGCGVAIADEDDGVDDDNEVELALHVYQCWDKDFPQEIDDYETATRGQAKWQFAKDWECDYFNVRSRKLD